jgi:TonB-linked SusC/RagA family outer membrane protein
MYRNSIRYDPVGSFGNAMSFNPYTPADGNHVFDDGTEIPYFTPANMERLSIAPKNLVDNVRIFGKMEYKPIDGLTVTGEYTFQQGGTDRITGHNQILTVNPERFTLNAVSNDNTFYQKSSNKTQYNAVNLYAKYEKSIKDHNFSLLTGFNNEKSDFETFFVRKTNLISVDLPSISGASGTVTAGDGFTQWSVIGYFGRFNYNYKEKYFLEVNGRYDGSSKFPKNDRYGFFPSFSAGWAISKESFMENVDWISDLKLRASLGEIGNQNTSSAYPAVPGMEILNASWLNSSAGVPYVTLGLPALVSASFTWEKVQSQNIGFDARFFNGKLSTSLDVFTRETIGMLAPGDELPAVLGIDAPEQNVADLKATGWETQVNWRDKIGDFRYNIGVSLFDNQTEMTKVKNEAGLINQNYVGKKFGEIWGYETDRFYTVEDFVPGSLDENLMGGTLLDGIPAFKGRSPNPGDIKFVDLNGDGEIFSGNGTLEDPGDRRIIGNSTKRYQYGIFGGGSYRNFDFSFVLNGVGKKDVYINNSSMFPYTNEFQVVYKDQLDYWMPDNTEAFYPRNYPLGGVNYGNSRSTQTKYLLNAAYLRIKNVTLGYTLPHSLLSSVGIDALRIYVSGENLIDFDHVPDGINPELANISNGATYPYMKNYSIGLNMSF